jgi:hypothetical protein
VVASDGTSYALVGQYSPTPAQQLSSQDLSGESLGTITVSTTAGSPVLTANAPAFSIDMVGRLFVAYGLLPGGAPFVARIISFQSPTQVTLDSRALPTAGAVAVYKALDPTPYLNRGSGFPNNVGGIELAYDVMTEMSCDRISVITTVSASALALMDLDFAGAA